MILIFIVHVRGGIHMNNGAYTGNNQQKKRRKLINLKSK